MGLLILFLLIPVLLLFSAIYARVARDVKAWYPRIWSTGQPVSWAILGLQTLDATSLLLFGRWFEGIVEPYWKAHLLVLFATPPAVMNIAMQYIPSKDLRPPIVLIVLLGWLCAFALLVFYAAVFHRR